MPEKIRAWKKVKSWLQKDYIIIIIVILLFSPFTILFAYKLFNSANSSSIDWGISAMVQSLAAILGIQFILITILWTQASSSIEYLNKKRLEYCQFFWELITTEGVYNRIDRIRTAYRDVLRKEIEEGKDASIKESESEEAYVGKGCAYESKRDVYIDILLLCEDSNDRFGNLPLYHQEIVPEARDLGIFKRGEGELHYAKVEESKAEETFLRLAFYPEKYIAYVKLLNDVKKSSSTFFQVVKKLFNYQNREFRQIEFAGETLMTVQNRLDEDNIETHLHKINSVNFFRGSLSILTVAIYVMSILSLTLFLIATSDVYVNRFALYTSFFMFILPIAMSVLLVVRFLRIEV